MPERLRPVLAAVICLALLATACAPAPLPPRLGGLTRSRMWTGARAERMIATLHGQTVAPSESAVAEYGRTGELRVFLSRFRNPADAERALGAMRAAMEAGGTGFATPEQRPAEPGRWFSASDGREHAFWVSRSTVYWVDGDPARVSRALERLPGPASGQWT